MDHRNHESIAVVGSGCRFPGDASTPTKLWELLKEPKDVLSRIPENRFDPAGFYHPDGLHHGTSNVQDSYLLSENLRHFDAQFFGVKPVEANAIDPQQRLLIETVYESLESAGIPIKSLGGSDTSVFVGLMCEDYSVHMRRDPDVTPIYTATGIARSIISNRLSYFFDWHGPSVTIDTACSSSLVAVHQAVQSLRSGESQVALAAGANLILTPELYIAESNLKMLSAGSRSKMWDVDADGYARGEGVAAIVLKRLSDAVRDGDNIECIIRETGVNQDGHTQGITMPSAAAQTSLIRDTYAKAGLDVSNPSDRCQYFEAHGTGTPAGDPQEAEAISKAFFGPQAKSSDPDDVLYVGSIKTVVGHTEGTAGLAGLLKASLAIQHGIIPPNLLFNNLSPSVAPFYTNLEIPTKQIKWPVLPVQQPRRASVNSFGFGGTNAHAIIESFTPSSSPKRENTTSVQHPSPVFTPFVFSAASERSLAATLKVFSSFLKQTPVNLCDLSYTLHSRRSEFAFKTSFAASSIETLCAAIDATLGETARESGETLAVRSPLGTQAPSILGVFTGQGAQWNSMGSRLVTESQFIRRSIEGFDHVLAQLPPEDRPHWSIKDELLADSSRSRLDEAAISQPLCTAIQIILVDMLRSAGIVFKAVVGHSSGEIAAAYASGFISASDAIKISYYRGLYAKLAGNDAGIKGAMLAVGTSLEDAEEVCQLPEFEGRVSVAANNSPSSLTLSGDFDAIEELKLIFEDEKKFARLLKVDTAYHSHHMIPCSEPYLSALKSCKIKVNRNGGSSCSWFSSVYGGKVIDASDGLDAMYWKDNMIKPVLFAQAVQASAAVDTRTYDLALEIGPHPALQGPVLQTLPDIVGHAIPYSGTLRRWENDFDSFSNMLGFVWARGGQAAVDFKGYMELISGATPTNLVKNLPTYSWDHDREYWIETRLSKTFRSRSTPMHELLGTRCVDTADEYRWRNSLREREIPWLSGHKLQGQTVFPAAGYVSTAFEAAKVLAESREIKLIELQDFTIGRAISFNDDDDMGVETLITLTKDFETSSKDSDILADFKYHSTTSYDSEAMVLNASGRVRIVLGKASPTTLPPRSSPAPNLVPLESDLFYSTLHDIGYQYTGDFQALSEMKRSLGFGTGLVANPPCGELEDRLLIHPAMLDAALQATFLAFCWPGDGSLRELHVPTAIRRIRLNPYLCHTDSSKEVYFPLDSIIPDVESSKIIGDVEIFSGDGKSAMLHVEGINIMPFSSAVEANDRHMFSTWVWDVDNPNGEIATKNNRASSEEYELASTLERASVYFLRHLRSVITAEEVDSSEWHHKKLFEFADHIISGVKNGTQPFSETSWMESTREEIYDLMAAYPESIELRLVRTVGEHLPAAVRGEINILEYLMEDNLLNDFYEHGHGIIEHTEFCASMVEQIVHRYPNMKILEIGAGTGGATKKIFKKIGHKFSSYTFTDISTGFFEKAQEIFSDKSNKMIFKSLDCEKDISDQGYAEHSYDLIVASLVLHATEYLEKTMENVRRLLKPGGFLVMLELTADGPMRFGFCMSGLPGWWLGHKDGRNLSPLATSAQWHTVLQKTGFSGVDAITPEVDVLARPCFVIATQAVNDQVNILRQPLQSQTTSLVVDHLVVLGGAKLETMRLADRLVTILRPWCGQITKVRSLKEMTENLVGSRSHVLNLADLDEPIFRYTSGDMVESLKRLLRQAKTIFWVTRGCRGDDPYANMSIGFGRALTLEMPFIRTQFLDTALCETPDANLIGESMLRLCATDSWESDGNRGQILWSHEPEITQQDGRVLIPRLYHLKEANDRYNSRKRLVRKEAAPETSPVVLVHNESSYAVQASPPANTTLSNDFVIVNVQYSILAAIRLSFSSYSFLVFGSDANTGEKVCAISESNASQVKVPANWAVFCKIPASGGTFISTVAHNFMAQYICSLGYRGKTLIVHEPNWQLVPILRDHALRKGLDLLLTTSNLNLSKTSLIFVHPLSSQRELKFILPNNISAFVNLSEDSLGPEFLDALPSHCNCQIRSDFFGQDATLISQEPVEALQLIRNLSGSSNKQAISPPAMLALQDVISADRDFEPLTVIDWANYSCVPVTVQPVDATPLFANDRTYILFGLTSDLAQTLCHWMVRHGARYVAMTSRKPKVQQAWLSRVEALGATVKLFPNDIANFQDLERVCKIITDTLPRVAGIANGAMVLVDTLIEDLDVDSLETVLKPKVNGSINLEKIFGDADLDFFVMLSSIAAIYGNERQSNYGIANTFMTGLVYQRRARGQAASILHIGPIVGSGYITREASENTVSWIRDHGHLLLSERDFVQGFGEAILVGRPELHNCPEIVLDERAPIFDLESQSEEINDPKFRHIIKIIEDSSSGQEGGSSSIPVKLRLMGATSSEELIEQLQNSFIEKLQILLQLTIDETEKNNILGKGANDLGIDSLIAVDLRTWFLKELDVDMPVLKILGGMSVRELLAFTVEKLPEKLTSSLSFEIANKDLGKLQAAVIPSSPDKAPESSRVSDEDQSSTYGEPNGQSLSVLSSVSTLSEDGAQKPQTLPPVVSKFIRSEPMSFGQARLWSMMALLEDPTALNIACFVRMTGNVRVSDLERAVHDVSQAHEALRTCFFEDASHRLMQAVLPSTLVHLENRQIHEGEASREFDLIKGYAFDVESGQGMRVILLSENPKSHYIIIIYHHIVMDGVSLEIFLSDLQKAYNRKPLPSKILQYPDFSLRQLKYFQDGGMASELRFWQKEFSNIPPPIPLLPFSDVRSRKTLTRYDFNSVDHTISTSLSSRIKGTCRKYKTTPFHFFLASYKALLFRFLRSEDLCIGMADANRLDSDAMSGIGCYLNLLPLRFTVKADQKFSGAIQEVRAKSYAAIANSSIPFDVLLEELHVPRTSLHSPLFQAFINYRQGVTEKRMFGESQAEAQEYLVAKTAYDISLDIIDNPGGNSTVSFMVQKDLYGVKDAEILIGCYVRLLEAFSNSPETKIVEPSLYSTKDLDKAIDTGRGPTTESQWPKTLINRVDDVIRDYTDGNALSDDLGHTLSYGEMGERVNAIASMLLIRDVSFGANVAVYQEPSVDWVCSMLAIMRVGAVFVPLDLRISAPRLQTIVKDCTPALILAHDLSFDTAAEVNASGAEIINISSTFTPSVAVPIQTEPEAAAAIYYTSGSTGIPKGITLKHFGLLNVIEDCAETYNLRAQCVLQQSALSFDMSLWQTFNALATGGTLHVVSKANRVDPGAVARLFSTEKIAVTLATPSEYVSWLRAGNLYELRKSNWDVAVVGGEQLTEGHLHAFQELAHPRMQLFHAYGPTEVTFISSTMALPYKGSHLSKPFPVGLTCRNCSIYIVDEDLQLVPVGSPGEILIGGVGVTMGYLNNAELTKQKYFPDAYTSSGSESRMLHRTGDRGRLRPDGALIIEGRIDGDTQVKLRGIRIDLQDIENTIIRTSKGALLEAVVSLRRDSQILIAHVVFAPEHPSSSRELFLQNLLFGIPLPQYMCPAALVPLDSLPMSDHGKVDRSSIASLPLPEYSHGGSDNSGRLLSETELRLKQCWDDVLSKDITGLHHISSNTDFFHVGGNSGLLVRLHRSIQKSFGVTLRLIELFETSTLRSMAAKIDHAATELEINWLQETKIDPSLPLLSSDLTFGDSKSQDAKIVLLTGATGNLGGAILRRLVTDPAISKIHCVAIRASDETAFRPLPLSSSKIMAHYGDLAAPDLGLPGSDFKNIAASADVIIHCGAQRSFWEYYQALKAVNVGSTKALVRLAQRRRIPLHFLSSGGVFTLGNAGVYEGSVAKFPPPTDGSNGYLASKWAAEQYLEAAASKLGVPVTIHRPVAAPDNTRREPSLVIVEEFLDLAKSMSALPSRDGWTGDFDLLSLEQVVDNIATSALTTAPSDGAGNVRYYHHNADISVNVKDLFTKVEAIMASDPHYRLDAAERIPAIEWMGRAKKAGLKYMIAAQNLVFDVDGNEPNAGLVSQR